MKKIILLSAACFAVAAFPSQAQQRDTLNPGSGQSQQLAHVPPTPPLPPLPPPPPPAPPAPDEDMLPPIPPAPPPPPHITSNGRMVSLEEDIEIVNENGSEITVSGKGKEPMVIVKKNGSTNRIKLSTWNKDRKFYEKKFGKLPPPPPPLPVPAVQPDPALQPAE